MNILSLYTKTNTQIIKANDCYLTDSSGKKYIDFVAGVWCANIGHSHPEICDFIENQIRECIHHGYRFYNIYAQRLSEKLNELLDFQNGKSFFLCSGSEVVNLAIAISQKVTGKKKILKIDNSYLSAFGKGQISEDNKNIINVRYNDLEAINKINFDEISAFVLETGGASIEIVKFPEKNFVETIIRKAKDAGCHIIVNEVTTGIGRTGKLFGYQHYGITPDIVATGKGIGNGYPISALTINESIADKIEKSDFVYGQSHQNDALGCGIALKTLEIIERENLIEKSLDIGEYFKECLTELKNTFPDKIKEIRARGLLIALEFQKETNGLQISEQLFENGFVVDFKLNTLRFLPSLTLKRDDILNFTAFLKKILKSTIS